MLFDIIIGYIHHIIDYVITYLIINYVYSTNVNANIIDYINIIDYHVMF